MWIWTFRVNRGSGSTATRDYLTLGQHDKSLTQIRSIRSDSISSRSSRYVTLTPLVRIPNSEFQLPTLLKATGPNLKVHDGDPVGKTAKLGSSLRTQPPTLACLRSSAGISTRPNPLDSETTGACVLARIGVVK